MPADSDNRNHLESENGISTMQSFKMHIQDIVETIKSSLSDTLDYSYEHFKCDYMLAHMHAHSEHELNWLIQGHYELRFMVKNANLKHVPNYFIRELLYLRRYINCAFPFINVVYFNCDAIMKYWRIYTSAYPQLQDLEWLEEGKLGNIQKAYKIYENMILNNEDFIAKFTAVYIAPEALNYMLDALYRKYGYTPSAKNQ